MKKGNSGNMMKKGGKRRNKGEKRKKGELKNEGTNVKKGERVEKKVEQVWKQEREKTGGRNRDRKQGGKH